ncbi:MAG: hypothetical protein ACW98U_13605 [Candidatus Thorarchaeota archaeon]|jgi:predicted membrane-bound mannosyltransferase
MQSGSDLVIISGLASILISGTIGVYLFRLWRRQETRLMTDLPLVFAITTFCQALQIFILTLPNIGLIPQTMELFRLRSLIIGGSVVPVLGALLQIWAPRIQKYHNRIVLVVSAYWGVMALLGTTESFIMIATIPIILIFGIVMAVTFAITWKTGRLKEVRSDLMMVSIVCGMSSQSLRVPLLGTVVFYLPDILLMLSMLFTALAFGNPWYRKEHGIKETSASSEIAVPAAY